MSDLILPLTRPLLSPLVVALTNARRGGKAPIPAPTTASFTAAQFAPGFTGSLSTTKVAGRIYGRGERTLWVGYISGTESALKITSEFNNMPGMIQASINGGAFYDCPNVADSYSIFSGLADGVKLVQIRVAFEWSEVTYISDAGDVLTVTGVAPTMIPKTNRIQPGTDSASGFYNGATVPNIATFSPVLQATKGTTYGSSVGSIKIRGAFTELAVVVMGNPARIGVSKNGGAPAFYSVPDEAAPKVKSILVPCDGSLATYNVWDSGTGMLNGGLFSVAGDAPLQDIGLRARLDQFGDSITYGTGAGPADVETMYVAAQLGFTGSTYGVPGHTIAQCKALLDVVLPLKTVSTSDVAVLAIGVNNSGSLGATAQADYLACIDKLLAKGYGKVLCRAILPKPDGSGPNPIPENTLLQSVVTTKADPKVIWVSTTTWLGYGTTDGLHPNAAGYVTLAGFAVPAYSAALGA